MSVTVSKDVDKIYCKSVAKSISNVIRFSLDEEFRKSSFETLGVSSTTEAEKEINRKLTFIIKSKRKALQNEVNISKKRRKNLLHKQDMENKEEPKDILDENKPIPSHCISEDKSQMFFTNFFPQNEPQTSSQYLQYFSQPELIKSDQRDFQFMSNLKYNYSQPSITTFHPVLHDKTMNSSSEMSDDGINYYQKMFKDSFKNNAKKYLKKNLKSYKNINF